MAPQASNTDIRVARAFHDRTAHTPYSVRTSTHTLEWDIKPFEFKVYPELEAIPLPRDLDPLATDTFVALAGSAPPEARRLTLVELASILYHSAGVTKKKTYPGGMEILFRAAASTGALYQTEVYVAVGDVEGLGPGLYHFCPGDFSLRRLRDGDARQALAAAAADDQIRHRSATIILTAIYWRNTWKYQARGYRHLFWDSGTMLANLLACARVLRMAPRLSTGFVDAEVNHLLGLDVDREAALELVVLGPSGAPAAPARVEEAIRHAVVSLSSREVDYPALREMYLGSTLDSPSAVAKWRAAAPLPSRRPAGTLMPLPTARTEAGRGLGATIQRRGSTREFSHAPLSDLELATLLWSATRAINADVPSRLTDLYLIVNAVEGIPPGAYCYWPDEHGLELVRQGEFRNRSAYLCLEQPLGGDAAAVIYFMSPLNLILDAYGNRGYRLVNLEAGLVGGRAYLAAYAQGFGASGLTFYDERVVEFFSPHAAGKDAIFVTALGRSQARGRSGEAGVSVINRLRREPS